MLLKIITAAETRNLRQLTLRQHQPAETLVYPGDDSEDTVHFGVFEDAELVGIASLYNDKMKDVSDEDQWRLRGMATTQKVRGKGYGRLLMLECLDHARKKNGRIFWCNARISAEKFYEKFGMKRKGGIFYPEDLGPHVVMTLDLQQSNNY